jgi:pimeloyl-ACP methyl ester carboxylesterase
LAAIPGAEEVVIDGSAHLCNVDGAPAFNERLDSFLQGSGEKTTDLAFRPGQTW